MESNDQQQQQTEIYPPPPPWYRLYRLDADGSAERPLPPAPPAPVHGDYQLFGRMESTEAGIPPLAVKQLFHVRPNGSVDFKGELLKLNRELLVQYLDLVDTLIDRPSSYARGVEAISTIIRNMHFLLNHLRSHQARASLEFMLQTETNDRVEAIADLRERRKQTEALLRDYAQKLLDAADSTKADALEEELPELRSNPCGT